MDQRQEDATKTATRQKRVDGSHFLQYFGPLLDALRALGGSGTPDEVVERIAADLKLSDEVQNETVPSGGSRLRTNVAWARFYLVQEGLLDSSERVEPLQPKRSVKLHETGRCRSSSSTVRSLWRCSRDLG